MTNKKLYSLGWDAFFEQGLSTEDIEGGFTARIIAQKGEVYTLLSEGMVEHLAKVTGRFIYKVKQVKDYPVVGDFVIAGEGKGGRDIQIHKVLERKNSFSRKMPISGGRKLKNGVIDGGTTQEQVVATNIDTLFIICSLGLDGDFNIPRLERYLTLAKHQSLNAVILLNKLDLCESIEEYIEQVHKVADNIPVLAISAITAAGIEQLSPYLSFGKTIAFIGSSGVGKSTLLNSLLEMEIQKTNQTSDHSGKGKHTTTHRQMFFHPSGCIIIDTPGMKEIQLWADEEDLELVFKDILEIMDECRFTNCSHNNEPGCALNEALETGALTEQRYTRYKKTLKKVRRLGERKKEYNQRQMKRGKGTAFPL